MLSPIVKLYYDMLCGMVKLPHSRVRRILANIYKTGYDTGFNKGRRSRRKKK